MPSKSQERRLAAQREATEESADKKRFYFPDIGNGVTVLASSLEEATEKAEALLKELQAPAEESKSSND